MWLKKLLLTFVLCVHFVVPLDDVQGVPEEAFPQPVSAAGFREAIAEHLQLVEFYSPFCHHCKKLAPIWEKTWRSFREEGKKLNISLIQVNCVENGDLCAEERIQAFPSIKLYGPSGFIKDFPNSWKRNEKTISNFARQEAMNLDNFDTSLLYSKSKFLDGPEFLDLIAGNGRLPNLVSFWPSEDLKNADDNSFEFENCDDCHGFQKTWTLLSNKLEPEGFITSHFNCAANKKICQELGLENLAKLTNHRSDRKPRVALVLPNKTVNNLFFYRKYDDSVQSYADFATRTYSNAQIPEINIKSLGSLIEEPLELNKGQKSVNANIYIVFKYESETVVQEDFDMLEQLIEPISRISSAFFYKSSDDLMGLSRRLFNQMYSVIDYEDNKERKKPNEEFFTMSTLTQYPTFFLFKQGSLIPTVFNGYSTTEMRNLNFILQWLSQNSLPLLNEVTSENFNSLLGHHSEFYNMMAVQLLNTSSDSEYSKSMNFVENFLISAFDYEATRNDNLYETVLNKRLTKEEAVRSMKNKNAPSAEVVQKMRDEIAHSDDHRVLFAYLDLAKHNALLNQAGLNAYDRVYNSGDILIIDKVTGSHYYDRDQVGNTLTTTTPYQLKDTLARLNFPTKFAHSALVKTPIRNPNKAFYSALRAILHPGAIGYALVFVVFIFALLRASKAYRKSVIGRKYRSKRDVTGILGKPKPIE
ncbi:LAQU0S04e04566g1_1 [Lachancea quebecensis]|uniref:LAQU0S04e04566g1_1 n=1 Tax=Lachancea quebecensis TaxID=1654605 RepID=A0A0P1KPJ7_9SACH|nr:LAQU0S04e04566g1_1 [Lachancea quebecensis]